MNQSTFIFLLREITSVMYKREKRKLIVISTWIVLKREKHRSVVCRDNGDDIPMDSVGIDRQASSVFDTFEIHHHFDLIPMDDLDQDPND